jgi:hypothetical protein
MSHPVSIIHKRTKHIMYTSAYSIARVTKVIRKSATKHSDDFEIIKNTFYIDNMMRQECRHHKCDER